MEEKELTLWMKNQEVINERIAKTLEKLAGSNSSEHTQELADHLKSCPNCQNAIQEIVNKKWDLEDDERDEDED